jgi:hypothetical protein
VQLLEDLNGPGGDIGLARLPTPPFPPPFRNALNVFYCARKKRLRVGSKAKSRAHAYDRRALALSIQRTTHTHLLSLSVPVITGWGVKRGG